jgi:heme-degrading monooxygenase HmoA
LARRVGIKPSGGFRFPPWDKESPVYTLLIESRLKPGKKEEFVNAWKSELLPLLKKQSGFVDEVLLFDEDKQQGCVGLCLWKTREQGERYRHDVFPQTKYILGHLCSNPRVRGFDVEAGEIFKAGVRNAA